MGKGCYTRIFGHVASQSFDNSFYLLNLTSLDTNKAGDTSFEESQSNLNIYLDSNGSSNFLPSIGLLVCAEL